jgi:hypothetical protein
VPCEVDLGDRHSQRIRLLRGNRRRGVDHSKAWLDELLSDIEGWTYLDEAWALHEAVRCFPGSGALTVVEIASWMGAQP